MLSKEKEELFEVTPIPKAVAKLSIPTVAASLVMVLYSLADTFFVGQLNSPIQTSAVTLAAPVLLAFNAVTNLFGTGCSSLMSRRLGVKDYEGVTKTAAFGIYGCLVFGLFFSLLASLFRNGLLGLLGADSGNWDITSGYLFWTVTLGSIPAMLNVVLANLVRAEGEAFHASAGTMSGCLLNILLDPLFIMPWGLGMGAIGAGLATFLSNCVACIYYLVYLFIKKNSSFISFDPQYLKPDRYTITETFKVGIPASIQNLLNVTGMTLLNNLMSVYGTSAVSAMGITHKIALVPMYFSMGMGQGILPLVGYNYASKNIKRMKESISFTEKVAGIFMVIAAAFLFFFSEETIGLFMKEALTISYGGHFLKGAALATPFLFFDFLAVGIFQACGLGKEAFFFAIARKILLEIPALILLNRLVPMYGLAYAQLVSEVVLSILAFIILNRIYAQAEKGSLK